jgi:hypothetical protein
MTAMVKEELAAMKGAFGQVRSNSTHMPVKH